MNPKGVLEFLKVARRLLSTTKGLTKADIMEFARRSFGQVSELLEKQIDNLFKKTPASGIKKLDTKKGEVVDIKKQKNLIRKPEEFATRKEYEQYLDETLGPPDDVFGSPLKDDLLKEWDKVNIENVTPTAKGLDSLRGDETFDELIELGKSDEVVKGEDSATTKNLTPSEREFLGFPNRKIEAMVRTAARDVLEKSGLGFRIKGQDPIDMARQIYGEEILEALDNISEELLEVSSYPELSRVLTEKKIYDFKPRQGLDIKQKGEIEDITAFDPKDRKPNAGGGLNYLMGL